MRNRLWWVGVTLSLCMLCMPAMHAGADEPGVVLTVEQVRVDQVLLDVGTIENPRPNMGIVMFSEVFDGLWLTVVSGANQDPVLPLDESGQFIRTSMMADKQSAGKTVTPVEYVILDLDNVPEAMTLESAKAAALASCLVVPQESAYDAALEAAPDGRVLVPDIDALLGAQAE